MPTIAASADLPLIGTKSHVLGEPHTYLRGQWEEREWRNIPGPLYGANTDSCWVGRLVAPNHVTYEEDWGSEVVFRQPSNPHETHQVLSAARSDPYFAYACDGDHHWTLELIREWWAGRARLTEWLDKPNRN
ncbi:ferredoxin [Nocardia altamirensis]|uniref:ferredoxin n=1 Tax=Nocardia altamirensis TaxID=472158 RepID=UPI00157D8536|nr:ferredoxin [Nocardia altamirensis]